MTVLRTFNHCGVAGLPGVNFATTVGACGIEQVCQCCLYPADHLREACQLPPLFHPHTELCSLKVGLDMGGLALMHNLQVAVFVVFGATLLAARGGRG